MAVPVDVLMRQSEQALVLVLAVSLPILLVAAIVGVGVAALQAATSIQDPTLSHLPRFLAVSVAIGALAASLASPIRSFAVRVFELASQIS